MDKESITLELVDELTMIAVTAKFGSDVYFIDSDGTERLQERPEEYYLLVNEDITNLIDNYLHEIHKDDE